MTTTALARPRRDTKVFDGATARAPRRDAREVSLGGMAVESPQTCCCVNIML